MTGVLVKMKLLCTSPSSFPLLLLLSSLFVLVERVDASRRDADDALPSSFSDHSLLGRYSKKMVDSVASTRWEPFAKKAAEMFANKDVLHAYQDGLLMEDRRRLIRFAFNMTRMAIMVVDDQTADDGKKVEEAIEDFGNVYVALAQPARLFVLAHSQPNPKDALQKATDDIRYFCPLLTLWSASRYAYRVVKEDPKRQGAIYKMTRGNAEQALYDYVYDALQIMDGCLTDNADAKKFIKEMREALPKEMRRSILTNPKLMSITLGVIGASALLLNAVFMIFAN